MTPFRIAFAIVLGMAPAAAWSQGVTQSRDGLGSGSSSQTATGSPSNSLPAGAMNATTGPQAHPAYKSGSTTANPGAAFARSATPKPQSGQAAVSPGAVSTTTVSGSGRTTKTGGAPVGEATTPPK